MKCPICSSPMKTDALFTSVKYECESLYCGLKEECGWYFWNDFKEKYNHLNKSILVEYINKITNGFMKDQNGYLNGIAIPID